MNTNKITYDTNEQVKVSGSLSVSECANTGWMYKGTFLKSDDLRNDVVSYDIEVLKIPEFSTARTFPTSTVSTGTTPYSGPRTVSFVGSGYDAGGQNSSYVIYNMQVNFVAHCKGTNIIPANATSCPLNEQALHSNADFKGVPSCTSGGSCEFICNSGFEMISEDWEEGQDSGTDYFCVLPTTNICTGTDPTNATLCPYDDQGLTVNTPKTIAGHCSYAFGAPPKCEYTCNSGYVLENGVCVLPTEPIAPPVLIPSSGECGDSGSKSSCKAPTTNLCSSGSLASPVKLVDNKWTWECKGKNGGEAASCLAIKDCSWTEVNP